MHAKSRACQINHDHAKRDGCVQPWEGSCSPRRILLTSRPRSLREASKPKQQAAREKRGTPGFYDVRGVQYVGAKLSWLPNLVLHRLQDDSAALPTATENVGPRCN